MSEAYQRIRRVKVSRKLGSLIFILRMTILTVLTKDRVDREGGFVGTSSSYARFKSGYIFVNTIERGAYVSKMQNPVV
jgi:hypothetical protein